MKSLRASILCVLISALCSSCATVAPSTVASKGISDWKIVIASDAIPSERYAAEELQRHLEKIGGAKLAITTDDMPATQHEIILGDNAHLRKLDAAIDFKSLGTDGFVLRSRGNRVVIAGGKPRGTLYGVYALLEEKLGVRWLTPDCEIVPRRDLIEIPAMNETQIPPLEYREVYWTEILRDGVFAARHRLNGANYPLTEKQGGRAVQYFPFVHSMDALVPPELFATHPEYFPEIGGKRVNGYVQRCLSNPDVIKMAIERVRQWIKEHPEANIISVSQNDTGKWCQCEKCKALDAAEGSPSASMIKFVNAIAADIAKDFPNIRIDTLAYQNTRKPPKTLRPLDNVIVRLCSIECCFAHPLETCPAKENERFRDDIIAWQPVAPLLYVWDYTTDFGHYELPFPNFDALQPNVRFFVQHGVKGLFEQGNYQSPFGELEPLRAYLLAKILWDPNTDVEKHTTEFLDGYYGAAAPQLRAYLDLLKSQVRGKPVHAHIYDGPKAAFLNDDFIARADRLFDDAARAVSTDAERERIDIARLPISYVKLAGGRVTGDARSTLLKEFLAVARKARITNISEGQSLDAWAKKMGEQ